MRLLYLAHHFPPLGGAGVQRSLKFIKYLPEFGIHPVVITGTGKPSGRWSPEDKSLLEEIPVSVAVLRYDDATLGGALAAAERHSRRHDAIRRLALSYARDHQVDAILVSMSPFEDAAVAAEIARLLGKPWIADLRDPWALDEFQVHRWFGSRWLMRGRMRKALASADLVIMNTPESAHRLQAAFPEYRSKRVASLTNGYDAADFAGPATTVRNPAFTIVHAGYLHTAAGLQQRRRQLEYAALGRMQSGVRILPRSHFYLLHALRAIRDAAPEVAASIRLLLIGPPTEVDRSVAQQSGVGDLCSFLGYKSHLEALDLVRTADLLFLPMHALPPGTRSTIVPGKAYEYMASRRPILAALPEGDAKDYLNSAGSAQICEPEDAHTMEAILRRQHALWVTGTPAPARWCADAVERFERRRLTDSLAAMLRNCLQDRATSGKLVTDL